MLTFCGVTGCRKYCLAVLGLFDVAEVAGLCCRAEVFAVFSDPEVAHTDTRLQAEERKG